jgi:hypothetical protein
MVQNAPEHYLKADILSIQYLHQPQLEQKLITVVKMEAVTKN